LDAGDALRKQTHFAVREADHLLDVDGRADTVNVVGAGVLGLGVLLREGTNDLVLGECFVREPQQIGVAQDQRHHHERKHDRIVDGQNGELARDTAGAESGLFEFEGAT
jgi:hypothetical protein